MKRWKRNKNDRIQETAILPGRTAFIVAASLLLAIFLAGCAKGTGGRENQNPEGDMEGREDGQREAMTDTEKMVGISGETAKDTKVDFGELQVENPDIFAWLYIPDTDIDAPVLQSTEADDYYENHNAYGKEDSAGAFYTELANLKDMCDFNTVVHGKTTEDGKEGLFSDLYRFADPVFFETHEDIFLYLDGNLLSYTVIAAYERENTSLIREYDFTFASGCGQFLEDMYKTREMGKNIREGWEEITPYHFLLTLTTRQGTDPDKQFVVIGVLTGDAAGKIDRVVEWE